MTMSTSQSGSVPSKKIAIVAVDGISDQQHGDSVHAIANVLRYNDEKSQYSAWTEKSISIPVEPITTSKSESKGFWQKFWQIDERGKIIRNALNLKENIDLDQQSHKFTCDFLNDSPPRKKSGYDTICIKGQMEKEGQMETEEVHLYEMYWADLSRLGNGFLQFFSEFYQILFHLSSLGRQSIDMAALEHHDNKLWRSYSCLYGWAVRIFTLPIPILSLFLLVAAFLSLPGLIPQDSMPIVVTVISTLLSATIMGVILWKGIVQSEFHLLKKPFINLSIIIVITAIVTVIVHGLLNNNNIPYYKILAIAWLVILSFLIAILINQYSLRRPGASPVATILGVPLFLAAIWNLFVVENSHKGITDLSFKLIEIIYSLVATLWIIFYIFYVLIVGFGLILWLLDKIDKNQKKVERTKRALWTGCVSLCISCILFISVTTTLWSVLTIVLEFKDKNENVVVSVLPKGFTYWPSELFTKLPLTQFEGGKSYKPAVFFDSLIFDPIFVITLIGIILVLVVAIVSFLPSLLAEIKLPDQSEQNNLTRRYGLWLTSGFKTVYRSLGLLAFLFALFLILYGCTKIFPSFFLTDILNKLKDMEWFKKIVDSLPITKTITATIITASVTGLIALPSTLDNFTLGARKPLDSILDIDNYFRLHPLNDNPRSRIFSRYSSLLRYLFKDNKYDAIIIVAVSQGTVITADLLRYLKRENQILEKPIYLLSMGSPLKQLYGLAFPHLYDWVNYDNEERTNSNPPNPNNLGLEQWVNMFRSGDYVGRYLWRSEKTLSDDDLFKSAWTELQELQEEQSPNRIKCRESCLGAGAHAHYWDATNKVAEIINDLITEASKGIVKAEFRDKSRLVRGRKVYR